MDSGETAIKHNLFQSAEGFCLFRERGWKAERFRRISRRRWLQELISLWRRYGSAGRHGDDLSTVSSRRHGAAEIFKKTPLTHDRGRWTSGPAGIRLWLVTCFNHINDPLISQSADDTTPSNKSSISQSRHQTTSNCFTGNSREGGTGKPIVNSNKLIVQQKNDHF